MSEQYFVEVGLHQIKKDGQNICGDVFNSVRLQEQCRTITVLADGLGSGIKASVLATLTSTMACKFIASNIDLRRASEIIMKTLPVCSHRKIAYSTFTIVDHSTIGETKIIEYDNPSFLFFRGNKNIAVTKEKIELQSSNKERKINLYLSKIKLIPEDRLIIFSDGVTQAGMGSQRSPLGQGESAVIQSIQEQIERKTDISATELAAFVTKNALAFDQYRAKDDISCEVFYHRYPRKTIVVTGPPFDEVRDHEMAEYVRDFDGKKIICGGTTASIIARELKREITMNMKTLYQDIPPESSMDGVDLITEGTLTLSKLLTALKEEKHGNLSESNTLHKLAKMLLESDIVHFVVGTRINIAHHDPRLPRELEMRRNLMKNVAHILEEKFLKQVKMTYV